VVEDQFAEFNGQAIELLTSRGPARTILMKYISLHIDFISARHQSAPLFHQLTMAGNIILDRLIKKHFAARNEALGKLIDRGIRDKEFRKVDRFQTAVSIVSLIVFYFSAARVLKLLGHSDAYSAANLEKRKQHVLEFVRHGLFIDSHFLTP
jgi:hypothetical protein